MSAPTGAVRAVIVGLSMLLLTGACTDDDQPAAGPEATATGAPDVSPTESPGAMPSPDATTASFEDEDNVLNVAIREPNSLDPMRIQDPGSVLITRQLYEGLVRWDQEGASVEPAAAERIDVSKDARTFTFSLRPDATFHNGDPVTAQDFAFAFNRIALKRNGADVAYLLELVQGFDEVNAFGDSKRLSGVRTPDASTLVIKLSEPFVSFPTLLTHPSLVPLPEEAFKQSKNFVSEPIGNGPFELAQPFELSGPVVLRAAKDYFEKVSLEGIRFIPFPDAASSWVPFTNEQLDVTEVPATRVEQAREDYGDNGFVPLLVGSYYGFNLDSPELEDERLRRAVNLALDRETIGEDIFSGTLIAPRGIVPRGMPGFDDDACEELCEFDPEEAKRLVRELPQKGRNVTIEYTRKQPQARVARITKEHLEDAGLEVKLRSYSFNKYLNRLSDEEHSIYRLGWISEYPDPDVFLAALFDSDSPDNHAAFASDQVDSLLEKAQREGDVAARTKLYQEAERAILEQTPLAPLGSFRMFWAAQPRVDGVTFDVLGGFDAAPISLGS